MWLERLISGSDGRGRQAFSGYFGVPIFCSHIYGAYM